MPDPRIFPIDDSDDISEDVTGESAVILEANDYRADVEIVNDGDVDIWLSRGPLAQVGYGDFLVAGGGSYSMDTQNLYLGEFSAICVLQEEGHVCGWEGVWKR